MPDRLSKPDLRSTWERLSPTLFSPSVRVSTPLRRSLPERRPMFDRLSSIAMIVSPTINRMGTRFGEWLVKLRANTCYLIAAITRTATVATSTTIAKMPRLSWKRQRCFTGRFFIEGRL